MIFLFWIICLSLPSFPVTHKFLWLSSYVKKILRNIMEENV